MTLRENVKKMCELRGMTQKELAEKLGITDISLNATLKEGKDPRISTIVRIANALDVPMVSLLGGDVAAVETREESKQGLYCPHCGKPLTLFVKAEDSCTAEDESNTR